MLPSASRIVRPGDFTEVARRGQRASRRSVGVTVLLAPPAGTPTGQPRVGFVVDRRVGTAVERNLVRRRLRHAARGVLPQVPPGARVVVTARAAARSTPWAVLVRDVQQATAAAVARASSGEPGR